MLRSMSVAEPADLSVYDKLCRSDEELAAWLASGLHHRELVAYLGESEVERLTPWARAAANANIDRSQELFILPGIMGTQLGRANPAPWPANLLWPDPMDIVAGRMAELALPDARPIITLGAISYSYLPLLLRLRAAGLNVRIFAYDWRYGLMQSGAALAQALQTSTARELILLGHSMGGLVARAALGLAPQLRVSRVITIGTPHAGSLAPLQALRGVYPSVRRLAALDNLHSAEYLASNVFGTFQSLYDMLPAAMLQPAAWPSTGPQPRTAMLEMAATTQAKLAAADERFISVAGSGERTACAAEARSDGFHYRISSHGDGTVSESSATLPGARNFYCNAEHTALVRHDQVAGELQHLLVGEVAKCALAHNPPTLAAADVWVSDAQLGSNYLQKVDWRTLSPDERRRYLNQLNQSPPQYAVPVNQPR
jgi:hypothetical protein